MAVVKIRRHIVGTEQNTIALVAIRDIIVHSQKCD